MIQWWYSVKDILMVTAFYFKTIVFLPVYWPFWTSLYTTYIIVQPFFLNQASTMLNNVFKVGHPPLTISSDPCWLRCHSGVIWKLKRNVMQSRSQALNISDLFQMRATHRHLPMATFPNHLTAQRPHNLLTVPR